MPNEPSPASAPLDTPPSPAAPPAPPAPTPPAAPPPSDPSARTWRDTYLSEDLRGEEALAVFDKAERPIDALSKSFLETQRMARTRVPIPKEGDQASFDEFAQKMRPEKAEDYKIMVPEGMPPEFADAARGAFYELGLNAVQAEKLTEWWNGRQRDDMSKLVQENRDAVSAIELDLGPEAYAARNEAAVNMLKASGIDVADLVPALEQLAGGGKALAALHSLAEKTGELGKVDGATVTLAMGKMTPEAAQTERKRMDADPVTRAKLSDHNSPEYKKRQRLIELEANLAG